MVIYMVGSWADDLVRPLAIAQGFSQQLKDKVPVTLSRLNQVSDCVEPSKTGAVLSNSALQQAHAGVTSEGVCLSGRSRDFPSVCTSR